MRRSREDRGDGLSKPIQVLLFGAAAFSYEVVHISLGLQEACARFLPDSDNCRDEIDYKPNTHTNVALPCDRNSGVRATRPRLLRGSGPPRPSQQRPDAIAIYCLP